MPNHLCADEAGRCMYVVEKAGDKCPVHRHAHQGPFSTPCERCGKKIEARHLWVRSTWRMRKVGVVHVFHFECRPGRDPKFKAPKVKHRWTTGLGLYEESRER